MFIAVTRMAVPAEQQEQVAEAFRRSAPALKGFDGFLGFELWRDAESLQAVSRWVSRAAMEAYQRSDAFRAHHGAGVQAGKPSDHGGHAARGGGSAAAHYDAEVVV